MTAAAVEIPYGNLSPDALRGIVEEFVTRDGTDYGAEEKTLEEKTAQVINQIKAGKVVIRFDPKTETCGLFPADAPS